MAPRRWSLFEHHLTDEAPALVAVGTYALFAGWNDYCTIPIAVGKRGIDCAVALRSSE